MEFAVCATIFLTAVAGTVDIGLPLSAEFQSILWSMPAVVSLLLLTTVLVAQPVSFKLFTRFEISVLRVVDIVQGERSEAEPGEAL